MTKFIKLTEQSNNKIHYVNINYISQITTDEQVTVIRIKDDWLFFNQSVDEVIDLINFK